GFRQPIGYDHRDYRRLVGAVPAGQLETILNDVRRSPASWELLSKNLLNDLRRVPGGPESLLVVLEAWNAHPEGAKLVLATLEAWGLTEPGYRLVSELPALVVGDTTLTRELRLAVGRKAAIDKDTRERLLTVVRSNVVVREQLIARLPSDDRSAPLLEK